MANNLHHTRQSGTSCSSKTKNLTCIKWAHAVNGVSQLMEALNSNVDMIEADVLLGQLVDKHDEVIPIMAHPPNKTSDLSLSDFLQKVEAYNSTSTKCVVKGIKLDFKSIEAFETALQTEKIQLMQTTYPLWLNADIIDGPCKVNHQYPVDAKRFLTGCLQFPKAVLSIGWTTDADATFNNGSYSEAVIKAMITSIYSNNVTNSITFPVRAGIAVNSIQQLQELIYKVNKTNKATLTIWSSPGDHVDIEKLEKLISCIGLDSVYLDVPMELSKQLKIINCCNK